MRRPELTPEQQQWAMFEFLATVFAWEWMRFADYQDEHGTDNTLDFDCTVLEHDDIYEFVAQYLTGAAFGDFMDAFSNRATWRSVYKNGVKSSDVNWFKHPGALYYLLAYQAGRLAREIVLAHGYTC